MLIVTANPSPFNALGNPDINPSPEHDNADALNELLSTKEVIYLPPGTYEIGSQLDITKTKRIFGVPGQTTLQVTGSTTNAVQFSRHGTIFQGIDLDCDSLATYGFRLIGAGSAAIMQVNGANALTNIINGGGNGNLDILLYKVASSTSGGDNEAYFDNGTFKSINIIDCDITALIKANPVVEKVRATKSRFQNGNKIGLEILIGPSSELVGQVDLTRNVYSGNAVTAEISVTANNVTVTEDTITGGSVDYAGEFVQCSPLTLNDVTATGCARSLSITNCATVRNNGMIGSGSTGHHVFYQNCSDVITDGATLTGGTGYGISHAAGSTNYDITNCTINGQSTLKKGIWHNHSADVADVLVDGNDISNCTEHAELWTTGAITVTNYTRTNNTYSNTNAGYTSDADITYVNKVESNNS